MVLKGILSFALFFSTLAPSPSLYSVTQKRADKALDKYWQGVDYKLTQIEIDGAEHTEIYAVHQEGGIPTAYVLFAEALGKVDTFIYLVIFSPEGSIKKVAVLLYRENYGGEIASKRFLRQFEGKSNGLNMEYNQDIDGISGATISVQAITRSIRENSSSFNKILKQLE